MVTNQRPEKWSYRTRGSVVRLPDGRTDAKNTSLSALMTPSAVPALVNVLNRPLIVTKNCVGPAAPIVSGGNVPGASARVGPRNLVPGGWGVWGGAAVGVAVPA